MLTLRAKHAYTIAALSLMLSTVPIYSLDKETTKKAKSVAKIAGGSVLILSALYLAHNTGFKKTARNILNMLNPFYQKPDSNESTLRPRVIIFDSFVLPILAGGYLAAQGVKDLLKK